MQPFFCRHQPPQTATAAGITGAAAVAGVWRAGVAWATSGPSSYTATWASVDQHPPAPEWFQDAKFGIYYHWGVFSVPAFGNEWYPRNMYIDGSAENSHHIAASTAIRRRGRTTTSSTVPATGPATSCSSRRSCSRPGGNFDPDEWAQLFADAGAKFAGPVAEHHDGFSMWNSRVNEWNSVRTGPQAGPAAAARRRHPRPRA